MSAISQKSISGITSITTPASVDNQFTIHTNNTTEAFKLDHAGNIHIHNHVNTTGISSASNFKTGTSNLHSTGLNIFDLDVDGHTNLDNVSITGVTTFSHTGANQLVIKDSDTSGDAAHMRISFQDSGGTEKFFVGNSNSNGWLYLGSPSGQNNNIAFRVNGSDKFQVNAAGAYVNGDLTVNGTVDILDSIIHTGDTNTKIRFPSADTISFETAGSERLNIASNGDVTITNTSSNPQLALISANDGISEIQFGDGNDSVRGNIVYRSGSAGDALCFNGYNNTERLRITSAGKVLIGHTSPIEIGVGAGYQMPLQVIGTSYDTSGMVVARYQDNNGGPTVSFVKSRNATKGAQTIVQANDNLGMIRFLGSDGTDTQNAAARIRAFCDGTPASNKIPGRITFETTDTLTYARERMRIDSSGRVVIGGPGSNGGGSNTYIGGGALAVLGTPYTPNTYACFAMGRVGANVTNNTAIANIRLNGGPLGTGRGAEINAYADANWSDASSHPTRLTFHTVASSSTSATERLRIKSDGNITISNTATSPTGDFRMLTLIARSDKQASIGFAQASGVYSGATATGGYSIRLGVDAALELSTHNSNLVALKALQTGNVESVGIVTAKNFNPVDVQLSHRNMVINGDMRVNQRGDAINQGNAGTFKFSCDRFNLGINGPYMDIAQDAPAAGSNTHPNGFRHSYKLTTRTPVGSVSVGNLISIGYKFEGYQIARLGYGSGALYNNPKSFTISFWAKSSLTGTFAMNWSRDGRIINRQFTISSANTWEYFKATIPPDTSIVGQHENATAMSMSWLISGGTNYTGGAALSTWHNFHVAHTGYGMNMNHITTTNATFQITGVQLEEGTVATPFEFIDYATQFQLCRRYYAEFQPTGQEQIYIETGNNNTHSFWNAPIPPGMRATPTAILNGTWTGGGMVGGRSISQVALQSLDNRNAEGAFGRASFRITRSGSAYSDGVVKHTDAWAGGTAYIGYDAEL